MGDDSDGGGGSVVGSLCVEVKLATFVEHVQSCSMLSWHLTYKMRKYPVILK